MRYEFFMAMNVKIVDFCGMTPCSSVGGYLMFQRNLLPPPSGYMLDYMASHSV